jgi:hypothetical protein
VTGDEWVEQAVAAAPQPAIEDDDVIAFLAEAFDTSNHAGPPRES